jgi:hypothetical protein
LRTSIPRPARELNDLRHRDVGARAMDHLPDDCAADIAEPFGSVGEDRGRRLGLVNGACL